MSDSVRPHRRQPTRPPRPWDSPGKNTGVGCHFLLQCIKLKSESEVAQSCPTLSNPMDHSFPGSSIHGVFQARVLEWEIKEQRGLYLRDFNAFNRKPTHVKKTILVEAPSTWTEKTEIVQNEKWPGGGTATLYKQEDDRESNPFANIGYFLCKRNND